jgi:hypothetical protein
MESWPIFWTVIAFLEITMGDVTIDENKGREKESNK